LTLTEALLEVAHGDERAVLFTVIEGEGVGGKLLVRLDRGETVGDGPPALVELAPGMRRSGIVEVAGSRVFAEVYGPPPRLIVIGAVDTGEALCAAARALGWHTVCVDARAQLATCDRVPSAEEIVVDWPDEALGRL
jgi:xanthine dehydrogenase accessory factor